MGFCIVPKEVLQSVNHTLVVQAAAGSSHVLRSTVPWASAMAALTMSVASTTPVSCYPWALIMLPTAAFIAVLPTRIRCSITESADRQCPCPPGRSTWLCGRKLSRRAHSSRNPDSFPCDASGTAQMHNDTSSPFLLGHGMHGLNTMPAPGSSRTCFKSLFASFSSSTVAQCNIDCSLEAPCAIPGLQPRHTHTRLQVTLMSSARALSVALLSGMRADNPSTRIELSRSVACWQATLISNVFLSWNNSLPQNLKFDWSSAPKMS